MMAALGMFVFKLDTVPFQKLQRTTNWRWATNSRIGKRPSYQNLGPGEDAITLSGVLLPEITGGRTSLDALRAMADSGMAWTLIDGEGYIYGLWVIESVTEDRSEFFKDGAARKIEFSLALKRSDDSYIDKLGSLTRIGLTL
ncbi:MAG: phage tail protein [Candidatus Pacearchaeota archaeon]|nr:phage tail protein [Candidatus Pacearchaeota archaeon]